MEATSAAFVANVKKALADAPLQAALARLRTNLPQARRAALARLPEYEALRADAIRIKDHTIAHLDFYLERFEARVAAAGGQVHWTRTPEETRAKVVALCRAAGATRAAKSKSMIGEEIGLNDHLARNGITPVETDLGEYILQLAQEPPSHFIGPALHKSRREIDALFAAHHGRTPGDTDAATARALVDEARRELRRHFLEADVGITGANMLIAETGSVVLVTNEGNGDLVQTLPRTHIVLTTIEKVVPTLEDAATLLRLLARSATGQELSVYTTLTTGPRRAGDADGPDAFHVILFDNGRTDLLGGAFQDMLRCIRCAACLNHCPVYGIAGGHAYGWVYPGPMGAVLTPSLIGLDAAHHLPQASTFCGACASVCPVGIALPDLMRRWREQAFSRSIGARRWRLGAALWGRLARRPRLYHAALALAARALARLGRTAVLERTLFAGWARGRTVPLPAGRTFQSLLRERR